MIPLLIPPATRISVHRARASFRSARSLPGPRVLELPVRDVRLSAMWRFRRFLCDWSEGRPTHVTVSALRRVDDALRRLDARVLGTATWWSSGKWQRPRYRRWATSALIAELLVVTICAGISLATHRWFPLTASGGFFGAAVGRYWCAVVGDSTRGDSHPGAVRRIARRTAALGRFSRRAAASATAGPHAARGRAGRCRSGTQTRSHSPGWAFPAPASVGADCQSRR